MSKKKTMQMRPGVLYSEENSIPNSSSLQSIVVTINDRTFSGTGRSKKSARRNAAAVACNSLFGTNFEYLNN